MVTVVDLRIVQLSLDSWPSGRKASELDSHFGTRLVEAEEMLRQRNPPDMGVVYKLWSYSLLTQIFYI